MNQTKKRLSIIKLAISMTDLETIRMQTLKLLPLQTDIQIQDIITLLESENYAQAQSLISHYIEYAPEEVVQRTTINVSQGVSVEDQAIIDEFQLIVTNAPEPSSKTTEVDINDFLSYVPDSTQEDALKEEEQDLHEGTEQEATQTSSIETLDEIFTEEETAIDAMIQKTSPETSDESVEEESQEIESQHPKTTRTDDSFFAAHETISSELEDEKQESEDDFFNLEGREEVFAAEEEGMFRETKLSQEEKLDTHTQDETKLENESLEQEEVTPHNETSLQNEIDTDTEALFSHVEEESVNTMEEETPITEESLEDLTPLEYAAMPHISLKLIDMKRNYPGIQKTYEKFENVESLIQSIGREGYTEEEIQSYLEIIKTLISDAQYTQAAQLLLVCAATESKFAQFMLARELYVGSVLSKNIPESFALMSALAIDDYPEALCDLGQFYENGIATKVDGTRAKELYKGAVDAGIQRANKHYTRLSKSRPGFFRA